MKRHLTDDHRFRPSHEHPRRSFTTFWQWLIGAGLAAVLGWALQQV